MATQTLVTLVCDGCNTEDGVRTRKLTVQRTRVEVEACDGCWEPVQKLANAGRRI